LSLHFRLNQLISPNESCRDCEGFREAHFSPNDPGSILVNLWSSAPLHAVSRNKLVLSRRMKPRGGSIPPLPPLHSVHGSSKFHPNSSHFAAQDLSKAERPQPMLGVLAADKVIVAVNQMRKLARDRVVALWRRQNGCA
jgi:hypothetical protein